MVYGWDDLRAYQVDESAWDEVWQQVKRDCAYLTSWGIQTLSDGLRGSVGSILLEPRYICKDHRNLFCNYYAKRFHPIPPYARRLHFFSERDMDIDEVLQEPDRFQSSYIGYSVIRPVPERCVGRTVIDPFKLQTTNKNNFFCLRTRFGVHVNGRRLDVLGYPYISQDGDVTVCAHTALWGVCRYLSERYSLYGEVYPFDLVNLTDTAKGRTFPYRTMTYSDYSSILSAFGVHPEILWLWNRGEQPDPDEQRNLYTYIESGFPILVSYKFPNDDSGHVVTLVGHTLDYDRKPQPDQHGFIDSSEFVKEFIVVDDNHFPYQLLGDTCSSYQPWTKRNIFTAVCPLPEKVFLPAEKARMWASRYFRRAIERLHEIGNGPYVSRLFLTTNSAFKRRCLQRAFSGESIDNLSYMAARANMPHFVWVMEVSPLSLYNEGRCTAEVVLDSTASCLESPVIYGRIGNRLFFQDQEVHEPSSPWFYPQFTHNLGER